MFLFRSPSRLSHVRVVARLPWLSHVSVLLAFLVEPCTSLLALLAFVADPCSCNHARSCFCTLFFSYGFHCSEPTDGAETIRSLASHSTGCTDFRSIGWEPLSSTTQSPVGVMAHASETRTWLNHKGDEHERQPWRASDHGSATRASKTEPWLNREGEQRRSMAREQHRHMAQPCKRATADPRPMAQP